MNVMNETELNAKFAALCMQRNEAQNNAVNLTGALAMANEHTKSLEAQLAAERERIKELEKQIAEKTSDEEAQPAAQYEPEVTNA